MCRPHVQRWGISSAGAGEGGPMSEFLMGLLVGVGVTAAAIGLGAWLMKQ